MPTLTWAKLFRQLDGGDHIEGRACAEIDTFRIQKFVHHVYRVLVRNMQRTRQFIYERAQIIRYPSLADACKERGVSKRRTENTQ